MGKPWYSFFVVREEGADGKSADAEARAQAPRRAADVVPEAEPSFTAPVANPTALEDIYRFIPALCC